LTSWVEPALSFDGRSSSVIVARLPAQKREARAMLVGSFMIDGWIGRFLWLVIRLGSVIVGCCFVGSWSRGKVVELAL
jgi:hypothetical protein